MANPEHGRLDGVDGDAGADRARPAGPSSRRPEPSRGEATETAPAETPVGARAAAVGVPIAAEPLAGATRGLKPGQAKMQARPLDASPVWLAGPETSHPRPADTPDQPIRAVPPVAPGRKPPVFKPVKPTGTEAEGKPGLTLPAPVGDLQKLILRKHAVLHAATATGPGAPAAAATGTGGPSAVDRLQVATKRAAQPGTGETPGRAATVAGHGEPGQASVAPAPPSLEPAGAGAPGQSASATLDQPGGAVVPTPTLTATPDMPAVPGARPPSTAPGAAEQIAVRLRQAADTGQSRVTIRLHPAELGRIDVTLQWTEDGGLRALLTAEKSETLDLLQRDARDLARALQDAGLKSGREDLSFDLRSDNGDPRAEHDRHDPAGGAPHGSSEQVAEPEPAAHGGHDGLLDLTV